MLNRYTRQSDPRSEKKRIYSKEQQHQMELYYPETAGLPDDTDSLDRDTE